MGILAVVALLGVGLGVLVYTPIGLRFAESFVRTRIGAVTYESLRGTIAGPIDIDGITAPTASGTWYVRSARLTWNPWALLRRTVSVQTLRIDGVHSRPSPTAPSSPSESAPASPLPIPVIVDSLIVTDLELPLEDPFTIQSVTATGIEAENEVGWDRVVIRWAEGEASAAGWAHLDGSERFVLDGSVDGVLAGRRVVADGEAEGTLDSIGLAVEAREPILGSVDGLVLDVRDRPRFDVDLRLEATDHAVLAELASFDEPFPAGRTRARLALAGTPTDLRVVGRLDFELDEYGMVAAEMDGVVRDSLAELSRLVVTRGEQRVEGSGSSTIQAPFQFDADLRWQEAAWPLDEPTVRSREGRLSARGRVDDFSAEGRGHWSHVSGIEGAVRGQARRAGEVVHVDSVLVDALDGEIVGRGRVTLGNRLRWDATLSARDVSTARWAEENPALLGTLSGRGSVAGALAPSALDLRATIDTLTGTIGSADLNASTSVRGQFVRSGDGFDLERSRGTFDWLEAEWGPNSLFVTGVYSDSVDARVTVRAPRLEEVWPGASGALELVGRVRGPRSGFGVSVTGLGTGLSLDSIRVDTLSADLELGIGAGGEATGRVTANGLASGSIEVDSVALDVTGVRDNHDLSLFAAAAVGEVEVDATGSLGDSVWIGAVDAWEWRLDGPGNWALAEGADVTLAAAGSTISGACWASGSARVCVDGVREADRSVRVRAAAERIPLQSLATVRFPQTRWEGTGSTSLDLEIDADGRVLLDSRTDVSAGRLILPATAGARTFDFPASTFVAAADSSGGSASGAFVLNDPQSGEVARFSIDAETTTRLALDTNWSALPVQAAVEAQVDLPAATARDLPVSLDSLQGRVDVDFDVTGTLGEPLVEGYARWVGGSFVAPTVGARVTEIDIEASGAGLEGLVVNGSFRAGGSGRIEGVVPLRQDADGRLRIVGEGLRLASMPDLTIESDLDLATAVTADSLRVTGRVDVTRASVELAEIATGVVRPSVDVVVVDDTASVSRVRAATTDLRLTLGDSVSFRGFGVEARPAGSITVRGPMAAPVASGEISLSDGTYRAFGQQLDIERGRFLFAGGPLMDPGLDVRAGREAPDGVVAGVEVSGTLRSPVLSVYSTPTMTEAEALSYVVLGRPLSDAGSTEDGRLVNAAATLGLRRSNAIASRIAPLLGLSEVRVDADGPLEEASLVAGRQFSSKLYVSYGVGLFQPVSTFRIRYLLSRRWTVLAESGAATGADLLFRIERGR